MCHGCYAEEKNGSAASELRCRCAWLHHGSGPRTHRIQGCGAIDPRPKASSPSDRHPDRTKRAVVLEAVKVWPGKGGACHEVGATANLDSSCARPPGEARVGTKKRALRSNKETDEGQKICRSSELLDKKSPIQGTSGANREAESTDAPARGGLPRSSDEAG